MHRGASKRWLIGVACVAAIAALAGMADLAGRSGAPRVPPLPVLGATHDVFDGDIGDPFVLPVAGVGYWVFGTNDWPAHVPTGFSTDLVHWQRGPDALPAMPRWAAPDPTNSLVWAPAVLATPSGYLMYVTVPDAASGRECIAAETSATPAGPYHDTSDGPLVCHPELGGSIDPMIVRDAAGQLHLLWKNDGNCCHAPVSLWSQTVSANGLHMTGSPHRLLGADEGWEAGIIERPVAVSASNGGWWLFHAGNIWQLAAYGTGLAYCTTLSGPCRDATPGAFLATHGTEYSPGGLDTFVGLDGTRWAV